MDIGTNTNNCTMGFVYSYNSRSFTCVRLQVVVCETRSEKVVYGHKSYLHNADAAKPIAVAAVWFGKITTHHL